MRRLTLGLLAFLLATPSLAAWRTESSGTVLALYWCAADARAQRVPAMIAWRYEDADTLTRLVAAHWLRAATVTSSPNCGAGQTEIVFRLSQATATVMAEAILRSEGYDDDTSDGKPDYDAMTPGQRATAFSDEVRDDLLQWEAEYHAYLAAQQAPEPDPVEPLP